MILNEICKQYDDFESGEHDPRIPSYLFNDSESKLIVLIDVPFCNKNEKSIQTAVKEIEGFHQRKV